MSHKTGSVHFRAVSACHDDNWFTLF